MADTDEEEVVAGLLSFTIGGEVRRVPELKWRANRDWQALLEDTFASLADVPSDTPAGLRQMADAERRLVLAYDTTGALGDLEDATEREIDDIYDRLMEVSFPLARSRTALMAGMVRAVVRSALENSMSGPSPTGTSEVPTTSKRPSRNGRSGSSTPRPMNGSDGSNALA